MLPSRIVRQRTHILAAAVLLSSQLAAHALDIEYIKIADTATTIPSAGGTFVTLSNPVISGYSVAFQGTKASYTGIFVSSGGTLSRTVDTTSFLPGTTTPFSAISGFSMDSNQVVFAGTGSSTQGIYLTNSVGTYTKVADTTTAIPNGTGNFTSFASPYVSSGSVAFIGSGASQQGVYSNVTNLHAVADGSTAIPNGTGNFSVGSFSNAVINFSDVGFIGGGSSSQQGVYDTVQGPLRRVADKNTAMPGGGGNFTGFSNLSLTYSTATFLPGNSAAIFSGDYGNTLMKNAATSVAIPDGTGNFSSFANPTGWGGEVAFIGNGSAGQQGLYLNSGSTNYNTVVNKATIVDGKTLTTISTGSSQSYANGNFVFNATFSDGSAGIYVAEQNYNWAANTSGSWETAANWSFGLKPRSVLYTNVRPDAGAVITGPAAATVIRGLNIDSNNGNGVAELRLQPGAQLSVSESTNVGDHGMLNVNGGSFYSNYSISNTGYINLAGGLLSGGYLYNNMNYLGVPGTIAASGTIGNHVENNGIIQVIGASARFTDSINNQSQFQIINGQFQVTGDFQNDADNSNSTSSIDVRNSILQFGSGLHNNGHLNFSFGTSDVFGSITIGGFNVPGPGQVIISGNSNVTFYDRLINNADSSSSNGYTFRISTGSTAIFFGLVSGAGSFTGGGTKIFEGDYHPGNSPASVTLDGPVIFDDPNTLVIEIGGPNAGSGFDHVHIAGQVTLGGTLKVTLINGYMPIGSTFNIMDFTSASGAFSSVPAPNSAGALKYDWTTLQTATNISVKLNDAFYDVRSGTYADTFNVNARIVKSTTGTATLTGAVSNAAPFFVTSGKLIFATTGATRQTPGVLLNTGSLSLSASTVTDVTNHDLMIGNTTLATVQAQILKGFNKAGAPTDAALTSSTALSAGNTFLVPIDADALLANGTTGSAIGRTFDGVAITQAHTILVKYTYIGDVTLDGKIDGLDFATAAGHFNQSTPGLANIQNAWLLGDVNLDGFVNSADFTLMSNNAAASQFSPLGVLSIVPVPEPASLLLLFPFAASALLRGRRTHRRQ